MDVYRSAHATHYLKEARTLYIFLFPLQLLRVDVDRQRSRECDLQRTYARLARLKEERGDGDADEGLGRYKTNAAIDEDAATPPRLDQGDER